MWKDGVGWSGCGDNESRERRPEKGCKDAVKETWKREYSRQDNVRTI